MSIPTDTKTSKWSLLVALTAIVAAALYAIVFATGVLTISLSVAAWVNDTTVVEYYQHLFPTYRGTSVGATLPAAGNAIFITYVAFAALLAARARRRFAMKFRN